jgi:hypothetical protein
MGVTMKSRVLIALLILTALAAGVSAQTRAEFSSVSGKVEIRPATGGTWVAARVGMTVDDNTMISTGFNATAELRMGENVVQVEQLTRMVFEEIVEQSDTVETRLNLNVGRMSAAVRSSDGRRQDFQVRSPISTAAVRGTGFTFDGERLEVEEGEVAFRNRFGQQRSVGGGQRSSTSGDPGAPSDPQEEAVEENTTSTQPIGSGSDDEDEGGGIPVETVPPRARATRGSVRVNVQ